MTTSSRQIGIEKEQVAVAYLEKNGYQVIERNFTCKQGEIDIIAKKEHYLVFIEVKYRKTNRYGTAQEAVNSKKQQRILQTASYYLYKKQYSFSIPYRFDVIAINNTEITLIENAF